MDTAERETDVLDRAALLEVVGDDMELLREVVGLFLADCPEWMAAIREAVSAGDVGALRRAVHTLLGAVSNFGGRAAAEAARRLNALARTGDTAGAAALYHVLEGEIERLRQALAGLVQTPASTCSGPG